MAKNKDLSNAKRQKKDEFYTQLSDIEQEMKHYWDYFKDAVIFCNCDDPVYSNFWKYFYLNFNQLGLKKLISTHFDSEKSTYKLEYNGIGEPVETPLEGNGDFHSAECIQLLQEADIVITNPPFSLFREYVSQLMEYGKKFLILGNQNAVTYKEIFPLLKENQMWYGASIHSGDREFQVPDDYPLNASGSRVDEQGHKFIRVKGVRWFTNLDYPKRHEDLILYKQYSPEEFPTYDNYAAINVDKTCDIPMDYDGVIGVPITFFDKFSPEQFEILGATESEGKGFSNGLWNPESKVAQPLVNAQKKYKRLFIRRKK